MPLYILKLRLEVVPPRPPMYVVNVLTEDSFAPCASTPIYRFVLLLLLIFKYLYSENAKEKKERKKEFMENKEKAFSLGNILFSFVCSSVFALLN